MEEENVLFRQIKKESTPSARCSEREKRASEKEGRKEESNSSPAIASLEGGKKLCFFARSLHSRLRARSLRSKGTRVNFFAPLHSRACAPCHRFSLEGRTEGRKEKRNPPSYRGPLSQTGQTRTTSPQARRRRLARGTRASSISTGSKPGCEGELSALPTSRRSPRLRASPPS